MMPVKQLKKIFVWTLAVILVLGGVYFFWLSSRYDVPILTYHDFGASAYEGDPLSVSPERFEKQMAYLKEYGYKVISLDELVDGIRAGKKLPRKAVVITMDDGNQTVYTYAYPVLKKYGFPATFFIVTNRIDVNKKYLTWDEIREMSRQGMTFGSHTKEHLVLSRLSDQTALWDEIAGSKDVIEKQIGTPVRLFCYPVGVFTDQIKALVKKAGYIAAVATNRGQDLSNSRDLYELHRISIRNGDISWRLRSKLSGYYNAFRKGRGKK